MKVTYFNAEEKIQHAYRNGEDLKFAAYQENGSQAVMLALEFFRHRQMVAEIIESQRIHPDDGPAIDSILLGGGKISKGCAGFASPDFDAKIGRNRPKDPKQAQTLLEQISISVASACAEKPIQ